MIETIVFFLESIYLIYMFLFFKTTFSYSNGLSDNKINGFGGIFVHDTGSYENKICVFGKIMAVIAVVLWFLRLVFLKSPDLRPLLLKGTIVFDTVCVFLAGVMNLNAFIYIVPLMFGELFFVKRLL